MVLEKTLESALDSKKIKPVHPKGNQPWIFIGRTDAEAEAPILWPPDAKSWLIGKDPDAGNDWGQEKKGITENEMVEWHHRLNGHEFEQAPGDGEGQGSLVRCCGVTKSRTWLNNSNPLGFWFSWSDMEWRLSFKALPVILVLTCYCWKTTAQRGSLFWPE